MARRTECRQIGDTLVCTYLQEPGAPQVEIDVSRLNADVQRRLMLRGLRQRLNVVRTSANAKALVDSLLAGEPAKRERKVPVTIEAFRRFAAENGRDFSIQEALARWKSLSLTDRMRVRATVRMQQLCLDVRTERRARKGHDAPADLAHILT